MEFVEPLLAVIGGFWVVLKLCEIVDDFIKGEKQRKEHQRRKR